MFTNKNRCYLQNLLIVFLSLTVLTGCFETKEIIKVDHPSESFAEMAKEISEKDKNPEGPDFYDPIGSAAISSGTVVDKKDDLVVLNIKYYVKDIDFSEGDEGEGNFDPIGGMIELVTRTLAGIIMKVGGNFDIDVDPVNFDIPQDLDPEIFKHVKINKVTFRVANPKEENENYAYNLKFLKEMKLKLSNDEIEDDEDKKRIHIASYKRKSKKKKDLQKIVFKINQDVDLMKFLLSNKSIKVCPSIKVGDAPKKGLLAEGIIDFTLSMKLPL